MNRATTCVLAVLLGSMIAGCDSADPKAPNAPDLEKTVRDVIEAKPLYLAHPMDGKYEFLEIVVVPSEIERCYENQPDAVLELLLAIAEESAPYESLKAVAYGLALVASPAIASAPVGLFKAETYDEMDKDWEKSPRQHWIGKLKKKIAIAKAEPCVP
jgi:hypothetical protein